MSINDLRCPDCGKLAEDIDGEIADCACGRAWEIDQAETYHPDLLAALSSAEAERDRLREELGLRFHDAVSPTEDEAIDLLSEELAASQADAERLAVVTDLLVRDSQCACLDDSGGCNRCMGLAALALHRSLAAPRPESEARDIPVDIFGHTTPQLGAATAELLRRRRDNDPAPAPPPVEVGQVRREPEPYEDWDAEPEMIDESLVAPPAEPREE